MPCPDENELIEFARGLLPEARSCALEEHLDLCADCRALAAEAAGGELAEEDLGRGVGRYAVLELISAGGMGAVYRAYDAELDRKVALKLLRPELFSGETAAAAKARLLSEAQALAKLSHPNVVAVYDAGTVAGEVFLAMELVDGGTLAEWLSRAPRRWDEVLEVFNQAGLGLACAHAARLLHRDFKPANVLVGSDGRVRVTDFGLARPLPPEAQPEPPAGPEVSAAGGFTSLSGTPAYMAPELWRGEPAGPRSDQFSFCVALWEALYGERPFPGGPDLGALVRGVLGGELRPPPASSRVPGWVREALARGLSRSPEGRYPSMEDLLRALSRGTRAGRFRRRAAALGFALAAAAAVGAAQLLRLRAGQCRVDGAALGDAYSQEARGRVLAAGGPGAAAVAALDRYAAEWLGALREACEATKIRGEAGPETQRSRERCLGVRRSELGALVEVLGRGRSSPSEAADAVGELEPPRACLGRLAALGEEESGAQRALARARALAHLGEPEEAAAAAEQAVAAAGEAPGPRGRAEQVAGAVALSLGRAPEAERRFLSAALLAEAAGESASASSAWAGLSRAALARGALGEAEARARHARAFAEAAASPRHRAEAAEVLADIGIKRQDWGLAKLEATRAVALRAELGAPSALAVDRYVLGRALLGARDPAALEGAELAWEAAWRHWGEASPRAARALCLVADAHAVAQLRREAQDAYERCAASVDSQELAADALANAAREALLDGRAPDALALWRRARERWESGAAQDRGRLSRIATGEAEALCADGRRAEAGALFDRTLGVAGDGLERGLVLLGRARCRARAGGEAERAQEIRDLREALPLLEAGGAPLQRGEARFLLARALGRQGEGALELARRAREDLAEATERGRVEEVERWIAEGSP